MIHNRGRQRNTTRKVVLNAMQLQRINRDDLLLYGIAAGVVTSGLWAIWTTLESPDLGFLMICGMITGFCTSLALRMAGKPLLINMLTTVIVLLGTLFMRFSGFLFINMTGSFWGQLSDPAIGAASTLGVLIVLTCFFMNSRQALIFTPVPVLAVYGLLASTQDPRIIVGFLCYLIATIFLLVFEHTLELRDASGLRIPRHEAGALPRTQFIVAGGIFLCVLILALSFTVLMMTMLSQVKLAPTLASIGKLLNQQPQKPEKKTASQALNQGGQVSEVSVGSGPLTPGTGTVMYVTAETPEMWRQRAYDKYTGHGWSVENDGKPSTNIMLDKGAVSFRNTSPAVPERLLRQTFRLAIAFDQGFPAASEPMQVAFNSTEGFNQLTVDRFGCLVSVDNNRSLPVGTTYSIVSRITRPTDTPTGARLVGTERDRYLQLPFESRELRNLVDSIVPRNTDPLRKVSALMGYLHPPEFTYTLDAPAVPEGEDAAQYFLFTSKQGYCDLFATSFALMCRATGLPSRFVVGYAEGKMNDSGEYEVTAAEAHAWVEVFIDGRGWMTFDPTPPGAEALAQQAAKHPKLPAWRRFLQRMRVPIMFFTLALLVTAALVKVLWFDPWWQRRKWERQLLTSLEGQIIILYNRMCQALAGRGLSRQPSQTPLEYLSTIGTAEKKVGLAMKPAEELTQLFIRARYAHNGIDAKAVSTAQNAYQDFRQHLGKHREA
jgi:transglutaminase-like putative cysteine protease